MAYRQDPDGEPYHSIDIHQPSSVGHSTQDERTPLSRGATPPPGFTPGGPAYPPQPKDFAAGNGSSTLIQAQPSVHSSHKKQDSRYEMLGNIQKEWDEFDSRNASQTNFQVAEGDEPPFCGKMLLFLINTSIVTRWIIFIIPVLGILWIPGILYFAVFHQKAQVWHVGLVWWSIWLSVIWLAWWVANAFAKTLPFFVRHVLALGARSVRKYADWLRNLQKPITIVAWSVAVYASNPPLIKSKDDLKDFPSSANALHIINRLCFGTMLAAIIYFAEKVVIQFVAYKFHELSYADRIAIQKQQHDCLVILYRNSSNLDRSDTLQDSATKKHHALDPRRFVKLAMRGVRATAETTTNAIGNLATEISGTSVLQPHSPAAMVANALLSANKTRMLARRIYYSFRAQGSDRLILGDISRFFPSRDLATFAFTVLDRDENGDATREEIEASLLDIHQERLSLSASMKDVDSATARLDDILMALFALVVLLIYAVMLDASVSSLVAGAGTFILGLSWLIGGSAQEVLTSIIFLFIKHPFDIGDGIEIDGVAYTVKVINLLSTVLVDGRGCDVQCPNNVLNTKYIMNRRRSGPMSETFEFTAAYGTSFQSIEDVRHRMLAFLREERRDFQPIFDVQVSDISDQSAMKLKADIKYKSNWQQGALKAQRRNKWICALKNALAASKIYGPSGDPAAPAAVQHVTLVPWEEHQSKDEKPPLNVDTSMEPGRTNFAFADRNQALLPGTGQTNVFDHGDEEEMRRPMQTPVVGPYSAGGVPVRPPQPPSSLSQGSAQRRPGDDIEMQRRRV